MTHGCARGYRRTPEYRAWIGMRDRVRRKPEYVGRGIEVCVRWQHFENFLADVGPTPSAAHWVERIDNDGHYEPSNVRWATIVEQTRNRRTTRRLTVDGVTHSLAEWAELVGIPSGTIRSRIAREGWPHDRAVLTPVRERAA